MTIEAHLATLEKKHGDLEQKLHKTLLHPSSKDQEIVELKREKLRLKDQIGRLREHAPQ